MIEKDPLVRWALAAHDARAWRRPGAVVVACPDLSHWDRLVMNGEPDALASLLREVLPVVGGNFRPFGAEQLVTDVVARMPELEVSARFAWMETTTPVTPHLPVGLERGSSAMAPSGLTPMPAGGPEWLTGDAWPEINALLEESFPDSYAKPGAPGVRRWAGVRGADGRLLAVAAEAWSTDEIGFLAGVTTHPDARGRGVAAALCAFAADEQLTGRERVALIVDYWNEAAIATYRKLGFTTRPVAAARQR
ncbi:GNAT family N-acetyltransferase [Actinoplanes sp. GCM10030250]|uniref:GNAT family N-acetyltransferase n=1 Tax=Actinoplanes sp. GCM10030250 TaxID=3273376 RepID=UPI0036070148